MPDALTTITHLINSPPGQLVAGGVLAGIVWKFFERVESILNDDTKLEIAVWLLDRNKLSPTFQNWPDTFAKVFDRVFGARHLSLKCFRRSCVASVVTAIFSAFLILCSASGSIRSEIQFSLFESWTRFVFAIFISMLLIDYITLLETRYCIRLMKTRDHILVYVLVLLGDLIFTLTTTTYGFTSADFLFHASRFGRHLTDRTVLTLGPSHIELSNLQTLWHWFRIEYRRPDIAIKDLWREEVRLGLFPGFLSCVWLWLYAGSGFLLKAARRFDIGFDWFNRRFDIEKKPLSSIGLVAGALVAVVYWTAVMVSRIV